MAAAPLVAAAPLSLRAYCRAAPLDVHRTALASSASCMAWLLAHAPLLSAAASLFDPAAHLFTAAPPLFVAAPRLLATPAVVVACLRRCCRCRMYDACTM